MNTVNTNTTATLTSNTSPLQLFTNSQFGNLRTLTIDNEPWFVGKDVAEALGYAKPRNAIATHVATEDKTHAPIQGGCSTGTQDTIIINESGLYSLILSSKLPTAKQFKHWVTAEVLPAIRKTGGYIAGEKDMTDEELICKAWFVGKDVASALGYSKERNAIAAHVDEEDKTTALIQGAGSNYKSNAVLINESRLYALVFGIRLETANQF